MHYIAPQTKCSCCICIGDKDIWDKGSQCLLNATTVTEGPTMFAATGGPVLVVGYRKEWKRVLSGPSGMGEGSHVLLDCVGKKHRVVTGLPK